MEIFMNLITQLFQNISGTIRNVLQRTRGSSLCGEDEELGGGTRPLLDSDASSTHSDDNRSNDIGRHQSLQKLVSRDSLSTLLLLVTPKSGDLDIEAIKTHITLSPESIYDTDPKGNNTVLHRIIEFIKENDDSVSEKHKKLLEFLVNNGASVNAKNISCETPLHMAARKNKYKTIQLLMSKGASINDLNNEHNTCLHLAVHNGCIQAVAILHCYADVLNEDRENNQGFTALQVAKQVEFNDNKETMEKICDILQYPFEEYKMKEMHKAYLKQESSDELWSLRPLYNINNSVGAGGNLYCGINHINMPDKAILSAPVNLQGIMPGDNSRPSICE